MKANFKGGANWTPGRRTLGKVGQDQVAMARLGKENRPLHEPWYHGRLQLISSNSIALVH